MKYNILQKFSIVLLFVFVAVFTCKPIETGDVWWHLSAGKYIAEHASVPDFDPFRPDGKRFDWVLTQWLGSFSIFSVYDIFGLDGLRIFRSFMFVIIVGIFFFFARRKMPEAFLVCLTFVMCFGLFPRSQLRPYLFNFILLQIVIILLTRMDLSIKRRHFLWIPLLGMLWFNLHMGAFVYGSLIFVCFLGARFFDILRSEDRPRSERIKSFFIGVLCLICFYLSFIFNPYGFKGLFYPFRVFFDPAFINFYKFQNFIVEQQPPAYLASWQGWWFYVLIILAGITFFKTSRKSLFHLLLFIGATFMFLYSQRSSAFFVLTAGYVIAHNFNYFSSETLNRYQRWNRPAVFLFFIIVLASLIFRQFQLFYYEHGEKKRQIILTKDIYHPEEAIRLLKRYNLTGPVFNLDKYGGCLAWHGLSYFVDGRQLNQRAWMDYRDIVSVPELFWPIFEGQYGFESAIISTRAPFASKLLFYLSQHPDWRLVSIDGYVALFVKKSLLINERQDLLEYEKQLLNTIIDEQRAENLIREKRIQHGTVIPHIRRFFFPEVLNIDVLQEGLALYQLGYKTAGLNKIMEAAEIDDTEVSLFFLDLFFGEMKRDGAEGGNRTHMTEATGF